MASILRRITDNWKLKTLAFAMAVLLWVIVSAEQPTTSWIWVPLEVQVTDPDYQLASSDLPPEVEVRFAGPGRDLLDLALRRPPLRLTVSEVEEPIVNRTLDPRMVQLPGQLTVNPLDVRPSAVRLEFIRMETRLVPLRVRFSDQLGEEWAVVDSMEVEPQTIRVSGPRERVQGLVEIPTETVPLTPSDSVFSRAVALDTTNLRGLELSPRSVQIQGRIDRVVERTLAGVPVDIGPGLGIQPRQTSVTIRGPQQSVEAITPANFRVVVSIGEIPARIPDEGVLVPLRIDGLGPSLEATLNPPTVRLLPPTAVQDSIAQRELPGVEAPPREPVEPDGR